MSLSNVWKELVWRVCDAFSTLVNVTHETCDVLCIQCLKLFGMHVCWMYHKVKAEFMQNFMQNFMQKFMQNSACRIHFKPLSNWYLHFKCLVFSHFRTILWELSLEANFNVYKLVRKNTTHQYPWVVWTQTQKIPTKHFLESEEGVHFSSHQENVLVCWPDHDWPKPSQI